MEYSHTTDVLIMRSYFLEYVITSYYAQYGSYMNMQQMYYPTNKYIKYKMYSPKRPSQLQLITLQNLLLQQHMPEYAAVQNLKCGIRKYYIIKIFIVLLRITLYL